MIQMVLASVRFGAAWLLAVLVTASTGWAKDTVVFQAGEWVNTRGSSLSLVHEAPHLIAIAFLKLDDGKFDWTLMRQDSIGGTALAAGFNLGVWSREDGARPYAALIIQGSRRFGRVTTSARFFSRHTREERLHTFFVAGETVHLGKMRSVGLFYQPILRTSPGWEHRLAIRFTNPWRGVRWVFEARRAIDEGRRSSALLEAYIPLSY